MSRRDVAPSGEVLPVQGRVCRWFEPRAALARIVASEATATAVLLLLTCLVTCSDVLSQAQRSLASGLVVAVCVQGFLSYSPRLAGGLASAVAVITLPQRTLLPILWHYLLVTSYDTHAKRLGGTILIRYPTDYFCFDHISGAHMNPSVSLAAVVMGRVSLLRALLMIGAQLIGAYGGAAVAHTLRPTPNGTQHSLAGCITEPAAHISLYQAVVTEAILTAVLVIANCASWDARTQMHTDSWPLRIGCTVAALSLSASDLTRASMNPVRSFGPALVENIWDRHWVYWMGPLCGAILSAALYRHVWARALPHHAHAALPPPTRHTNTTIEKLHTQYDCGHASCRRPTI